MCISCRMGWLSGLLGSIERAAIKEKLFPSDSEETERVLSLCWLYWPFYFLFTFHLTHHQVPAEAEDS